MYWTLELASKLEDAPWPATKDELIDYAIRSGAPLEVIFSGNGRLQAFMEVLKNIANYPHKEDSSLKKKSSLLG